jgi:hypothetical protein
VIDDDCWKLPDGPDRRLLSAHEWHFPLLQNMDGHDFGEQIASISGTGPPAGATRAARS